MSILVYGQPTGNTGYGIVDNPTMPYWMPALDMVGRYVRWKFPFDGGYKLHITASNETAEATAKAALPVLQRLNARHKVVFPLDCYQRMNQGEQAGKFITVYAGRLMEIFLDTTRELEAVLGPLVKRGVIKPGPVPRDRQSGHSQSEHLLGGSRMISYVKVDSFQS